MENRIKGAKKIAVFVAGLFLVSIGIIPGAFGATGSFDRQQYLPSMNDSQDYDRAWISVTDSAGNTTSNQDTVTVTIKAGSYESTFILKETGGTTSVFTSTGSTHPRYFRLAQAQGMVRIIIPAVTITRRLAPVLWG
ncbi:MAG: hypothetical protein E3K37_09460 [Candidatus Kuenenia sp.]|nr:hypothetical protein [Candidatus Kuenenia hertensis]